MKSGTKRFKYNVCTFSWCTLNKLVETPLVFISLQICCCVIRSHLLRLCLEKKQCDLCVKVYSAFDLHICYDFTCLITIFPLKHSRLNSFYKKPLSVSSDHENTAHRAASPALFVIYWATLYKWVAVSLYRDC